jgi:O-antigen/teichoic acid export membrane protein
VNISRSVLWNAAGIAAPLLVGIVAVPVIIENLGVERFGFLSVIWMMIGYFSVFDLGLGRSLTKLAADRLATGREREIPSLVSTTVVVVVCVGVLMGAAIALSAEWLARTLGASDVLAPEASISIRWLSMSLPFVLLSTALISLLEAYNKFALISIVRLPFGALMYLAPIGILPFSKHLGVITAVLAILRILNAYLLVLISFRVVPALRREKFVVRRDVLGPLMTYGGWLTVSNVVGPIMVYFDRFVIAAVLGGAAVAYYTVPYDVLTRLWIIPTAIQGVLFPAFAIMRSQNPSRIVSVFRRSSEATLLLMTPLLVATTLLAYEGLELWVGTEIAQKSDVVAKILVVGVIVNGMARAPFAFVQSAGYARWTALLHLIELPLYALLLWRLLSVTGIEGAAYAWSGRILVDTVILYFLAVRIERRLARTAARDLVLVAAVCVGAALCAYFFDSSGERISVSILLTVLCGVFFLKYLKGAFSPGARWPVTPG